MADKAKLEKKARQDVFIAEYLRNGHDIRAACRVTGIGETTVYRWKRQPDFIKKLSGEVAAKVDDIRTGDQVLLAKAKATLEQHSDDPLVAMKICEALEPEVYDPRIRAKIWERKQLEKTEQEEPVTVFRRSAEPTRLTLVKTEKSGTEG